MRTEKQKNHQPPMLIVTESYSGVKRVQEIFSDLILSELTENSKTLFSNNEQSSIMKETDNSQIEQSSKRLTV